MTGPSATKKPCPHCGKFARDKHRIPLHVVSSALILGAAFFFWASDRNRPADAGGSASATDALQSAPASGRLSGDVIGYIGSTEADKTCGMCLASADSFLEGKKLAVIREKTKDMILLPAGEYQTGSPDSLGDPDEHPRRQIFLDAFYLEKYEVTTADYLKFAKDTGDNYPEWAKPNGKFNIDTGSEPYYKHLSTILKTCGTCPVVGVTPKNADAYCQSKNRRLPTEAEWEAAARGGADSAFSFGDNPAMAGDYAWYETNSGERPQPVGGKRPNQYGLYDLHGNVWEWTSDLYAPDYYNKSPKHDPKGPTTGKDHVIRGGSWAFDADSLRSANRANTYKANDDIGFRCAVSKSALSADAASPEAVDIVRD